MQQSFFWKAQRWCLLSDKESPKELVVRNEVLGNILTYIMIYIMIYIMLYVLDFLILNFFRNHRHNV